jgi:hypothetical protein
MTAPQARGDTAPRTVQQGPELSWRAVASLHRGDITGGRRSEHRPLFCSGLCGYRPTRSEARQLGRRDASREPATGPALRRFDCARNTALPPDPLALCGTQHLRIADAFPNQVVHETSRSELGWPPCRVARPEPTGLDSAANPAPAGQAPPCLAKSLLRNVSKAIQLLEDTTSLDDAVGCWTA